MCTGSSKGRQGTAAGQRAGIILPLFNQRVFSAGLKLFDELEHESKLASSGLSIAGAPEDAKQVRKNN
jgi:hypothetical protein